MILFNERRKMVGQGSDIPFYTIGPRGFSYGSEWSSFSPYIQDNPLRGISFGFNLILPSNSHYIITAQSNVNDLYFSLQFFSYDQLDKVSREEYLGPVYLTSSWQKDRYEFTLPDPVRPAIAGVKINLARGINKNIAVDSSIAPRFTIWRI